MSREAVVLVEFDELGNPRISVAGCTGPECQTLTRSLEQRSCRAKITRNRGRVSRVADRRSRRHVFYTNLLRPKSVAALRYDFLSGQEERAVCPWGSNRNCRRQCFPHRGD